MPTIAGRALHAMAHDPVRQRILLFGGQNCLTGCFLGDTWEWTGARWVRRVTSTAPSPRYAHAMAFDAARGVAVLFGGVLQQPFGQFSTETWTWDGTTWRQLSPQVSPPPMYGPRMAYDPVRRRVVLVGTADWVSTQTWEWDGVLWTQVPTAAAPAGRALCGLVFDPNLRKVLLAGGEGQIPTSFADVWTFDGTTWSQLASLPFGQRTGMVMVADTQRLKVVAFGGFAWPNYRVFNDTWDWDGTNWSQRSQAVSPSTRMYSDGVFEPGSGLTLLGGALDRNLTTCLADTWTFDGTVWRETGIGQGKTPGSAWSMVTGDSTRRVVTVFDCAGPQGALYNELWESDGGAWFLRQPMPALPYRCGAAFAHDGTRGRTVLFGGQGATTAILFDETWEWDGTTWTRRFPANQPTPRWSPFMVEDSVRHVLLLHGGQNTSGIWLHDTWSWDGSDWTLGSNSGGPQVPTVMTFDTRRGKAVLYGWSQPGRVYETWEWDGTSWTRITRGGAPGSFNSPGFAFDEARGVSVLHGMSVLPANQLETWEWDGTSWQMAAQQGGFSASRHQLAYDRARERMVVMGGGLPNNSNFIGTSNAWFYGKADLLPWNQEARIGGPFVLTLRIPARPGHLFLCGLSRGSRNGIPVLGSGPSTIVWPLEPDGVWQASLGLPGLVGLLDPLGNGTASVSLPPDPSLVGAQLAASALTLDLAGPAVSGATRDVRVLVVR